MTTDPFERAAKREEIHEIKKEATKEKLLRRAKEGDGPRPLAVFFGLFPPYAAWGLMRAANHHFTHPLPQSVIHFLFHTGFWFAAATVVVVLGCWGSTVSWFVGDDD